MILLLLLLSSGCNSKTVGDMENWASKDMQPLSGLANGFAAYEEVATEVEAAQESYQVAADLSNITNRDMFVLSEPAKELLVKNGFVVVPSEEKEFFML